jgi:hypothetical protein
MAVADSRTAEDILQRMRSIRRDLDTEMTDVVQNARQLVDWRYYFNKAPWLSLCAAAAAGYLVVRPRTKSLMVDPAIREALSGNGQMIMKKRPSLAETVSGLLIAAAVRAGITYGSRWIGSAFRREADSPQSFTEADS